MRQLIEVSRVLYGRDERAINRHSERMYCDQYGNRYVLSRCLDGVPPFFEAYGPYDAAHIGTLPRLLIDGREFWGDGWPWQRAVGIFCQNLEARVANDCIPPALRRKKSADRNLQAEQRC